MLSIDRALRAARRAGLATVWGLAAALLVGGQCAPGGTDNTGGSDDASAAKPGQLVTFETTAGTIVLRVFAERAPATVEALLALVAEGFYDGLTFHEVGRTGPAASPANLWVVGGVFDVDGNRAATAVSAPPNESNNGLKNSRGSVAWVDPALELPQVSQPGDGTAFLINLKDNSTNATNGQRLFDFDLTTGARGYTVFGVVEQGFEIVQAIARLSLPQQTVRVIRAYLGAPEGEVPSTQGNQAPTADAGEDQTVRVDAVVTLDASGSSDPDGDTLNYGWRQTSPSENPDDRMVLSDPTSSRPTFRAVRTGTFAFQVTVGDGRGGAASDEVQIKVNAAMRANAGADQKKQPGEQVTLDGSGSNDPSGAAITAYAWTQLAGPGVTLDDASAVKPTFTAPAAAAAETLTFRLTITNAAGETASDTCDVKVLPIAFAPVVTYATGNNPVGVAAADFDGDGVPDIATANRNAGTVSVLLNDGRGTLKAKTDYAVGALPESIAAADFDGDGVPDIATANRGGNSVSLLINRADASGTFEAASSFAVGNGPVSLITADFDGDGSADLAFVLSGEDRVVVRLNDGEGGFAAESRPDTSPLDPQQQPIATTGARALAAGDFNNDRLPDLVVAFAATTNAAVLLNQGKGVFKADNAFEIGGDPVAAAAADFNGDGRDDIIVADGAAGELRVRRNSGNARFDIEIRLPTGADPADVIAADIDGDGRPDALDAATGTDGVDFFENKGNGAFKDRREFAVPNGPKALVAADLDEDSDLDLAVVSGPSNLVSVLINRTDPSATSSDEAGRVRLRTSLGDVVIALLKDAPATTDNFLRYVRDGFYNGTIFHRVLPGFVVQGGGFLPGLVRQTGVRDPVVNEFSPDRSNLRGTVAMAKVGGNPDSATSQFFFNLADNSSNLDNQNGGFTVFARVVEGIDVVDAMAAVATGQRQDPDGNTFDDVPLEDIVLISATVE